MISNNQSVKPFLNKDKTTKLKFFNLSVSDEKFLQPLFFVTVLFFLFGFITCLNDILIPHLKGLFTLSYTEAILIQVCFFSAYFFMSIPAGQITQKKGYRFGIVGGLVTAAVGTLGFIPAAQLGSYGIFLLSLYILASGITLLQVSVNPYVTLLGSPEKASFRLNLVQAFNSLGTTLAPYLGSLIILESADKILGVQVPYLALTIVLLIVAFAFFKISLPSLTEFTNQAELSANPKQSFSFAPYLKTIKENPHLLLGMFAIFFYVGGEVAIGSFLVSWLTEGSVAGLSTEDAGKYVSLYWGGAMVGRFLGSFLTARFSPNKVLRFSVLSCLLLIILGALPINPFLSTWAIIAIGLFNSIQFPTIFSLSVEGLGKSTPYASGLLCTCIVGGAIMPLLQGIGADSVGLRWSFLVPFICYLYIFLVAPRLQKNKK